MREISNALSDAIFTVCNKIISSAKFDKTYKCRIVSKVSDNKYIVMKDNIEHTVSSVFTYNANDIVTVLLPENNWKNATIVYPQDNLNAAMTYTNNIINNIKTDGTILRIGVSDTRNVSLTPGDYMKKGMGAYCEFKSTLALGITSEKIYSFLITLVPWHDFSGAYPTQVVFINQADTVLTRYGISDDTWGEWQ